MEQTKETIEDFKTALYRAQEERERLREENNTGQRQLEDLDQKVKDVLEVLKVGGFLSIAESDLPLSTKVATALAVSRQQRDITPLRPFSRSR